MKKEVKVSIVIPSYNEEKDIGECLESLKKQTWKRTEVIVIDDGSIDKTREIVKKFKEVKLINGEHKGPGFSRNIGAKIAKGEILIFVDSDMTFDKNYINNLVKPLIEDKKIVGTTHELEIVKNVSNIWSRCWGKVRVSKEEAKEVKIFRAIRKKEFLKRGGFDSKYGYADDQTLWFKYKIKPIVAQETICYHKNPQTLKGVYKQSRWIGASIDNILLRTPLMKYVIPLLMLLLSPILIPILSLKKVILLKDYSIFLPMILFMTARYFGSIVGISRNVYLGINYR